MAAARAHQHWASNEALAIARENIQWAREDFSVMLRMIEHLGRTVEQLRDEIRILSGHLARLTDEIEEIKDEKRS